MNSEIIGMCRELVMVRHKKSDTIAYVKEYFKEHLLGFMDLHGRETLITIKTMNKEFTKTP